MEFNPCLECDRKNQNKNHPVCRDCDKRVAYVSRLALTLSYTATYEHDRIPVQQISFVAGGPASLSLKEDAIY
jgi:hypothetical protein